ncbi:hypothetical protein [Oryzihumus sp.]|uniref:hypothetical protein n=1 Tax=Oryzihumus sp. TaxID=1968903 RepID=UPI002EDA8183
MSARTTRWRFAGQIAGLGTSGGTRVVIGRWLQSPLGSFADVMVERPDGHRVLLAPTQQVADFVAATYTFDEVRLTPVTVVATADRWRLEAGPLTLTLGLGRRTTLGWLLHGIPSPVATAPWFAGAVDPVARVVLRGVRTRGTAGQGRREWYGATDVRALRTAAGAWEGEDLGVLRPVDPPVRFGFGSTPARPSVTSVVTTVESLR